MSKRTYDHMLVKEEPISHEVEHMLADEVKSVLDTPEVQRAIGDMTDRRLANMGVERIPVLDVDVRNVFGAVEAAAGGASRRDMRPFAILECIRRMRWAHHVAALLEAIQRDASLSFAVVYQNVRDASMCGEWYFPKSKDLSEPEEFAKLPLTIKYVAGIVAFANRRRPNVYGWMMIDEGSNQQGSYRLRNIFAIPLPTYRNRLSSYGGIDRLDSMAFVYLVELIHSSHEIDDDCHKIKPLAEEIMTQVFGPAEDNIDGVVAETRAAIKGLSVHKMVSRLCSDFEMRAAQDMMEPLLWEDFMMAMLMLTIYVPCLYTGVPIDSRHEHTLRCLQPLLESDVRSRIERTLQELTTQTRAQLVMKPNSIEMDPALYKKWLLDPEADIFMQAPLAELGRDKRVLVLLDDDYGDAFEVTEVAALGREWRLVTKPSHDKLCDFIKRRNAESEAFFAAHLKFLYKERPGFFKRAGECEEFLEALMAMPGNT